MPRGRERYLRDRAERRSRRSYDRRSEMYPMDYRSYDREYGSMDYARQNRYEREPERYSMGYEQPRERYADYNYDMRNDYRRDYASGDMDEDYHEDLKKWTEKLKRMDRFGLTKEQVSAKGREMGIAFTDYDPDELYAVYLMQVSDYPNISNDPHTYLAMAKSWLEDKDIKIDPSEKLCKYMYEIVMAEE